MKYKLTNKEIAIKGYNGSTIVLPTETKVFKDSKGNYTETVFGNLPFKEEDLKDEV